MPPRIQDLKKALEKAKGASDNHFEQLQNQVDVIMEFLEATEKRRK